MNFYFQRILESATHTHPEKRGWTAGSNFEAETYQSLHGKKPIDSQQQRVASQSSKLKRTSEAWTQKLLDKQSTAQTDSIGDPFVESIEKPEISK